MVDNTSDFDADSLESPADLDDIEEVPESPLGSFTDNSMDYPIEVTTVNSQSITSSEQNSSKSRSLFGSSDHESSSSKAFPKIELKRNSQFDEKVLDYRNDIKNINEKKFEFRKMKIKEFKEVKKRLELEKFKQIDKSNESSTVHSSFVFQKMSTTKKTINALSTYINKLESAKQSKAKRKLIKTRMSYIPHNSIVDETNDDLASEDSLDDSFEVPDSLDEMEDCAEQSKSKEVELRNFIRKRQTIVKRDDRTVVNETIEVSDDEELDPDSLESQDCSSNYQSAIDSKCNITSVEDTFQNFSPNTSQSSPEIPLKVYNRKVATHDSNYDPSEYLEDKQDSEKKMLYPSVRKQSERKQLHGFMCKVQIWILKLY